VLDEALPAQAQADALLLVSELVSNSVRHAHPGPITVSARVAQGHVRVEVGDAGPGMAASAPKAAPSPDQRAGRGLYLLSLLADRWGTSRGPGGRVWFEISH
jgi:anti-sigma regulatory factor (Ser/Thr protein kinase)